MYKHLIACMAALFVLLACKKETLEEKPKTVTPPPVQSTAYFPKTIGSYWIYETEATSPEGTLFSIRFDSVWVAGDTLIKGRNFTRHASSGTNWLGGYFADSSNYIIEPSGRTSFGPLTHEGPLFTYTFDDLFSLTRTMLPETQIFSTLAGDFVCAAVKNQVKMHAQGEPTHLFFEYRAENIGLISISSGSANGSGQITAGYESNLVRYYIAP